MIAAPMALAAVQDTELIADLRGQLERVEGERDQLREALVATIVDQPAELREDDRRAAVHWYARWREACRLHAALHARVARLERTMDAGALQAARTVDALRAELDHHQRRAAFYKSCALEGTVPTSEQVKRMDAR